MSRSVRLTTGSSYVYIGFLVKLFPVSTGFAMEGVNAVGLRANVIWWVDCHVLCTLSCHTASRKHLLHCLATWNFNPFLLPTCSYFGHHQPSDAHLLPAVCVFWVSEAITLMLSLYNALPPCGLNMSDSRYEGTVPDASSSHFTHGTNLQSGIMLSSALRVCSDPGILFGSFWCGRTLLSFNWGFYYSYAEPKSPSYMLTLIPEPTSMLSPMQIYAHGLIGSQAIETAWFWVIPVFD